MRRVFFFLFFLFIIIILYTIFFHSPTLSVAVSLKQGCQRKLGGPFQGTGFQTSKAGGKGFKNKRQELAVWGWGWGWEGFFAFSRWEGDGNKGGGLVLLVGGR